MAEKIYIVVPTDDSIDYCLDYSVEAIFKDKSKAEHYCTCHENCEIEEHEFSDEQEYTPFNCMVVDFVIRESGNDEVDFEFKRLSKEDNDFYLKNKDVVTVCNDWYPLTLSLYRRLPEKYNEQKIRDKYTRVYQDLRAGLLNIISEIDYSSCENRKAAEKQVQKYIEGRFGIEATDE